MLRTNNIFTAILLFIIATLSSCNNEKPASHTDAWDLTEEAADSLLFVENHHYGVGYNFTVCADSIAIISDAIIRPCDTAHVYGDEELVVADFIVVPEDSIDSVWVKVARDQFTQGWIHESKLLDSVVPNDPISEFIKLFSDTKFFGFFFLLLFGGAVFLYRKVTKKKMRIVHFNDINSAYPTVLCILTSLAAVFYSSVRMFDESSWTHFYFHPTLNPFALPLRLAIFIVLVWSVIIVAVATLDDVFRCLKSKEYISYICSLVVIMATIYIFFTGATYFYFGYLCLPLYIAWSIWTYKKQK
ncbi:MAG: zinc ribbon domain-containing protein [Bacteroidaceae bacterium]|nr:zinc ribbon domain-containing protein [Bacteroidaceae bacterium]